MTFVRHGSQGPHDYRLSPDVWVDPPLSETGRRQAEVVGAALADQPFDAIFCSHLVRAHETADAVAKQQGLDVTVLPELREVETYRDIPDGLGLLDVMSPLMWRGVEERFVNERRWDVCPFSESSEGFRSRVVTVVEGIIASQAGSRIAIVCHGGVINTYIGHLLGLDVDMFFRPAHASVSRILVGDGRRVIHTLNEIHHLSAVDPSLVTF